MARFLDLYTNFTAGALSPLLQGQVNLKKYENSLETCKNFLIKPHGPLIRRPGSEFINNTRNNLESHNRSFIFSTTQAYILEFTENMLRFYTNGGLVLKSSGSPDFANGTFATDIASWTDASTGASSIAHDAGDATMQLVCGASGQAEARQSIASLVPHRYNVTLDVTDNPITYAVGTTAGASDLGSGTLAVGASKTFNFYSGSNTTVHFSFINASTSTTAEVDNIALSASPYEIATPWTLAEIKEAGFTQSADEIIIAHNDYVPRVLSRTASDNWAIAEAEILDGPYLPKNVVTVRPVVSQINTFLLPDNSLPGSQTLLASTAGTFTADDVGRHVRMRGTTGRPYGWGIITAYTSGTEVTVDWKTPVDGTANVVNGTFDEGVYGWPSLTANPTWDSGNQRMELAGTEDITQAYVGDYADTYFIKATVTGTLTLEVGTSSGASDLLSTTVTGTQEKSFEIAADGDEVFIRFRSLSGTNYIDDIQVYTKPKDSTDWFLGAWGDRSQLGYPNVASYFEQRLILASSKGEPQTFWGSQTGDFFNFSPDDDDNNDNITARSALNYTLADERLNKITAISGQGALIFHTSGPIFVGNNAESGTLPPLIVKKAIAESTAEFIDTVSTATTTVFAHGSKKIIFDMAFDFERDGYAPRQLSRLADQYMSSPITSIALQDAPDKIIWMTREDGVLLSLTFERDENVVAWAEHALGGTDTKVLNVTTIPSTDGTEVWMTVERTIDGGTKRFVERLKPEFRFNTVENAFFVDSGLTYDGVSAIMISGLDHLEGETVSILRDGIQDPDQEVVDGAITLTEASEVVHVGFPYESLAVTVPLEIKTSGMPTLQGLRSRIFEIVIKFFETVGAQYGAAVEDTLDQIPFRNIDSPAGVATPLFTGDKIIKPTFDYRDEDKRGSQIVLKTDNAHSMTVLGIVSKVQVDDTN